MPRGGRRYGKPGTAYANRTDLANASNQLPVQAPNGLGYGERKATEDAQRAVPLAAPSMAAPPAPLAAPVAPGELPSLTGPSARPDEPVTAGLPIGPGPGPEILGAPASRISDHLAEITRLAPAADLEILLRRARELGL